MNKIILIVFLILGITVNVFGATREKILRTGLVDTFAELDAIVADKALVNLADGGTFTGNIIANGNLSIGNAATTAGVLTLLEDTDAGSNFASFQVPALAANTIYTLPNAVGAAGNVLTDAAGNGILSWVEGGAGAGDITSVGDVATGAAFDGTQGTILTFYDVGGNMTLTYNGTTLTASKYITANVTGALTGNADTVTNGVYTTDAGTVFLAPAGDGASLTNVIHTEVDPTVDTAAEILTILDDTALDFGTGVLTATGFAGPLTGNADTVTNATLTTALTVNTGAVTLVGNAGASALTLGAGASSFSGTSSGTNTGGNTGDNTVATSGDSATDFFGEGEIVDARISDTLTSSTCTGNAATVTTNANLTGEVTSSGNAAVVDPTAISGKADTTIADGDFVLFWDLTDSTLKKVDGAELTSGGAVTALNNATANELVSVGATTTELDCESTLTFDGSAMVVGGTSPSITVGDAGTEDTKVVFDGNEQDFYIGIDDTDNNLNIGLGSAVGTTPYEEITAAGIITNEKNSGCRVYLGATQTVGTGSPTKLNLSGEDYDIQGEYVPYTDTIATQARYTATVAGYYLVIAKVRFASPVDQKWIQLGIYKNNAAYTWCRNASSGVSAHDTVGSEVVLLAVNDYVELFAYHNCGGDETLEAGTNATYMSVNKIR